MSWIGHVLRRDCSLRHVLERTVEYQRKRGSQRRKLSDDLKDQEYVSLRQIQRIEICGERKPGT